VTANTRADTCREYLGRARGYCPRAPEFKDKTGRGFCGQHAIDRKIA
jgi:hypothetical protein